MSPTNPTPGLNDTGNTPDNSRGRAEGATEAASVNGGMPIPTPDPEPDTDADVYDVPGYMPRLGWLTARPKTVDGEVVEHPNERIDGVGLKLLCLVHDTSLCRVVAADVRVTLQGKDSKPFSYKVEIPAEVALASHPSKLWQDHAHVNLSPTRARFASEWLSNALAQLGAPRRYVVSRARWDEDVLHLPTGYGRTDVDEQEAREAWAEIVREAAKRAPFAMMIGAAAISPMLCRLGVRPFTTHARGASTQGKSTAQRVSASIWGQMPDTLDTWDATANNIKTKLAESYLLPVILDDTGMVDGPHPDRFLADMVMTISKGQDRGRNRRDGSAAEQKAWHCGVLSSGEGSLLDAARKGSEARLVELHAPFTTSAEQAERLEFLARFAGGWSGHWLAEHWPCPTLPTLRAEGDIARRAAKSVAACVAGFEALARVVGVKADALALGQKVLDALAEDMQDRGPTIGEQLWRKVEDDCGSSPGRYPMRETAGSAMWSDDGRRGLRDGDYLFVYSTTLQKIAKDHRLDLQAATAELEESGRLLAPPPPRKNGRQWRMGVPGEKSRPWGYKFKLDPENSDEKPSESRGSVPDPVPDEAGTSLPALV